MQEPTLERSIKVAVTVTKLLLKKILQILRESTLERSLTVVAIVISPLKIVVLLEDTKYPQWGEALQLQSL